MVVSMASVVSKTVTLRSPLIGCSSAMVYVTCLTRDGTPDHENHMLPSTCSFVVVHRVVIARRESRRQSRTVSTPLHDRGSVGLHLRRWRIEALLTGRQLARRTGISQSKISKIETGAVRPAVSDVRAIGAAMQVSRAKVNAVVRMLRQAENTATPNAFTQYRDIEVNALCVDVLVNTGIPALLQTCDVSERLLGKTIPLELLPSALQARMERQECLVAMPQRFRILVTSDGLEPATNLRTVWSKQLDRLGELVHSGVSVREIHPTHVAVDFVFEDVAIVDGKAIHDHPMLDGFTTYDDALSARLRRRFDQYWELSRPVDSRRIDELREMRPPDGPTSPEPPTLPIPVST
jgi:transcriptional regulator with XRE-family HTH domain